MRHGLKRVLDDGITFLELIKKLSFLEVDIAAILEETRG